MAKLIAFILVFLSILPSLLSQSTTTPSASTSKPSKSLDVSTIPIFDFSEPVESPDVTCATIDLCQSLGRICGKGKCVTAKCEVSCHCNAGYTGPSCSTPQTEVEKAGKVPMKNGKIITTISTPLTTVRSNGKHHVNGNIDKTNGNAANGINSENNAKRIQNIGSTLHEKNKYGNVSENQIQSESYVTSANTTNVNIDNSGVSLNINGSNASIVTNDNTKHADSSQVTTNTSKTGKLDTNKIVSEYPKTDSKMPDGSYIKGPESGLLSDKNTILIENSTLKIRLKKSSIINNLSEFITIPTVSVDTIQVEVVPDSLGGAEPSVVTDKTKTTISEIKDTNSLAVNDVVNESKQVNTDKTKGTTNAKHKGIVSDVSIKETKQMTISAASGSVNISNHSVHNDHHLVKNPFGIRKNIDKQSKVNKASLEINKQSNINDKALDQTGTTGKRNISMQQEFGNKTDSLVPNTNLKPDKAKLIDASVKKDTQSKIRTRKRLNSPKLSPLTQLLTNLAENASAIESETKMRIQTYIKTNGIVEKKKIVKQTANSSKSSVLDIPHI